MDAISVCRLPAAALRAVAADAIVESLRLPFKSVPQADTASANAPSPSGSSSSTEPYAWTGLSAMACWRYCFDEPRTSIQVSKAGCRDDGAPFLAAATLFVRSSTPLDTFGSSESAARKCLSSLAYATWRMLVEDTKAPFSFLLKS